MGAFSAKFSTPPSGKTMDGSQKCFRPKMVVGPLLSAKFHLDRWGFTAKLWMGAKNVFDVK